MQHLSFMLMLAYSSQEAIMHSMTSGDTQEARLQFYDATPNIALHSPDQEPVHLYTARIGQKMIEFQRQYEDEQPLAIPEDTTNIFTRPQCTVLEDVSFNRWVRFSAAHEWQFHAMVAPTVQTLNDVRRTTFEPLGSHTLPLELQDGDGRNGLFKASTMVAAIADGAFLISTAPAEYRHDTQDHGIGVISLEAETVKTFQALCRLALKLESTDPRNGDELMANIIEAYDLATFYFNDDDEHGVRQLAPERKDALLSYVMQLARRTMPMDVTAQLIKTIDAGPFAYQVKQRRVVRYRKIKEYYEKLQELVA